MYSIALENREINQKEKQNIKRLFTCSLPPWLLKLVNHKGAQDEENRKEGIKEFLSFLVGCKVAIISCHC